MVRLYESPAALAIRLLEIELADLASQISEFAHRLGFSLRYKLAIPLSHAMQAGQDATLGSLFTFFVIGGLPEVVACAFDRRPDRFCDFEQFRVVVSEFIPNDFFLLVATRETDASAVKTTDLRGGNT